MSKSRPTTDYDPAPESRRAPGGESQDGGTLPRSRAKRIEAAFEPALLEEVARLRRARRVRAFFAIAAVLAVVAASLVLRQSGSIPEPRVAASLVRTDGPVHLLAPNGSSSEARVLNPGDEIPSGSVLEVGRESRAALRLFGGTSLRLDSETEMVLISDTSISLAKGALYVDSGAIASSSPSIRTPMGVVSTIGTQFELRLEADEMNVRVRDGAVRIEGAGGPVEARRSEGIVLRGDGKVTRERVAVHGTDWDWVVQIAPMPESSGTLAGFLAWFEREMGWQLRYSDSSLADQAETIEIQLPSEAMTPTQILPAVLEACELGYRLEDDVLIIQLARGEAGTSG